MKRSENRGPQYAVPAFDIEDLDGCGQGEAARSQHRRRT